MTHLKLPDNYDCLSLLRNKLPIQCVRVSSAKARGLAKKYRYWGAVRYEIRLTRSGISAVPCGRANSDRRSYRLAQQDAEDIAGQENRIVIPWLGPLTQGAARELIEGGQVKLTRRELISLL